MTPEQIEEFLEIYGDRMPNPENCPKEFNHLLRLYMYERSLLQNNNTENKA